MASIEHKDLIQIEKLKLTKQATAKCTESTAEQAQETGNHFLHITYISLRYTTTSNMWNSDCQVYPASFSTG